MKYSDESIFKGNFVDDKRVGKGVMTYPDGTIYDGDWVDDVKNGSGT